jgi:hypothetical protein
MNSVHWHRFKNKIAHLKSRLTLTRTRLGILVLGLVVLWALMWLGISTRMALVGQHVRELDDQVDLTQRQNAQLEYDIAVMTQPDRIAKRAAALGLRPASPAQIVYLDIKYPPRAAYAPQKQVADLPPQFDFALWWRNALSSVGLSASGLAAEASQ